MKNNIIEFEEFVLNTQSRELVKSGLPVKLTGKMYELLFMFLQNSGKVINKEAIYKVVWEGRVVSDSTLYKLIELLRNALEEDPKKPQIIQTIHGEGYLFTNQVVVQKNLPNKAKKNNKPKLYSLLFICFCLVMWLTYNLTQNKIIYSFDDVSVKITSDTENLIASHISSGVDVFLTDLVNIGRLGKLDKISEHNSIKNNLFITIDILSKPNKQLSANIEYKLNDEMINQSKVTEKSVDLLIEKVIQEVKTTQATKLIVKQAEAEFSKNLKANRIHAYAIGLNQQGNYKTAKNELLQALLIDENYKMAKFDLSISERNLSNLDKSLAIINSLEKQSENLYFSLKIARLKGNVLLSQNRLEEAREQYLLAIELAIDMKLKDDIHILSINLSILNNKLCQFDESINILNKIILEMENDSDLYLGWAYSALAETYNTMNEVNKSLVFTDKAISVFKRQNFTKELGRNYLRKAWLNLEKGNELTTNDYLARATEIYQSKKSELGLENINFVRFYQAFINENYPLAREHLSKQEVMIKALDNDASTLRYYKALGFFNMHEKDYDNAFVYFKKYGELSKSKQLNYAHFMSFLYRVEVEIKRNKPSAAKFNLDLAAAKTIHQLDEELMYRKGLFEFYIKNDVNSAEISLNSALSRANKKGNMVLAFQINETLEFLK